jgi:hypothetical protein
MYNSEWSDNQIYNVNACEDTYKPKCWDSGSKPENDYLLVEIV